MQNYIKDPWKYIDKNETQTDKNEVQTTEVIIVIHCLCYLWNEKKIKIDKCHDWIACRSTLCDDEKASVIEELSRVISNELGLREQLEVIRIINPSAEVSPTDKEFVIG